MKRPNYANKQDACCRCGKILPTPADHNAPGKGELTVHHPEPTDPPQWMCLECSKALEADARRAG